VNKTINDVPPRVGESSIDSEHDLQMQLLDSLAQALENGDDFSAAQHVLEQFIEFSDMHFLSEQLVMRLHNYPAYEIHLEEHTRLMKKVREIKEAVFQGQRAPGLQLIQELREWLIDHIASEDVAFGEFLQREKGPSA
jgi:hemerythrin